MSSVSDADRSPASIDAVLTRIASERQWERQNALDELRRVSGPAPLLAPLIEAIRDPARPERRNAARSALAWLAAEETPSAGLVLDTLLTLATDERDTDVRVLAASALGESRNPEARQALERALVDPEPNVAAAAADGLGVLGDARAVEALTSAVERASFWVQVAAVVSLGRLRDPRALPALTRASTNPLLSAAAAAALADIADPAGMPALRPLIERGNPVRVTALAAAARILAANPEVSPPEWLRESLQGEEAELDARFRESGDGAAAHLLGITGSEEAAALLADALSSPYAAEATAGLVALPPEVASTVLTERIMDAPSEIRTAILTVLPPLRDAEAVARVVSCLSEPDAETQAAVVELLARSDEQILMPQLLRALNDPSLRGVAVRVMGRLSDARCAPLASLLTDPDANVRKAAAEGLSRCATMDIREQIAVALRKEPDRAAQHALVSALGTAGGEDAVRELVPLLEYAEPSLRFAVLQALGRTGSEAALPPLIEALGDPTPEIQAAALHALGELGDPRAAAPLAERLTDSDRDIRRTAAFALRDLAPSAATEHLLRALDDPAWSVRSAAVRTLAIIGAREAVPRLRELAASDADPLVRSTAAAALRELTAGTDAGGGG